MHYQVKRRSLEQKSTKSLTSKRTNGLKRGPWAALPTWETNFNVQSYDYIITLTWIEKIHHVLCDNWTSLFVKPYVTFTEGCFVPFASLVEIGPVALEKIFKFSSMFFAFSYLSLLEKSVSLYLKKNEFTTSLWCFVSSVVVIGPVVLEMKILNFVNVFSLFRYYLRLEKVVAFHLKKLGSYLSPKDALCQRKSVSIQRLTENKWNT